MKKVWLFSRISTFTGNESIKKIMDNCRNKALEKGYAIVDETIIVGSSDLAMAAVKDIIEHNDKDNGAKCIFSINGNALARDLKTAQDIYNYIIENGMEYETSAGDVAILDKHNPVGAVFSALAQGANELPEDFSNEEYEDLDENGELYNEPMGHTM